MKTIEIDLYRFSELSEKCKDVVRAKWRSGDDQSFASEDIAEDIQYQLEELGYTGLKAPFSLGYSSGDGVGFDGSVGDLLKVAKRVLCKNVYRLLTYKHTSGWLHGNCVLDNCSVAVKNHNTNYYHWNSFRVSVDSSWYCDLTNKQYSALAILETAIQSELVSLSHTFESEGYKQLEYNHSDEAVDDMIEMNWDGEVFTEEGKKYL